MDFKVFDTTKIDEYSKRAKEQWGQTSEYKEFEEKQRTGRKTMKLLLQMSLCNYLLNSDK